jgi:predicted transposase YbfD/YdcC
MCLFFNNLLPENQVESPFHLNPIADLVKKEIAQRQPPPPRPKPLILECFSGLTDPRLDRKKWHLLEDIVIIAICGVLSGADDWVGIVSFGRERYAWLKSFLLLPNGIPSHDTFGRVFSLISPDEFEACFMQWISLIRFKSPGEIVAIDGKTLRRSHDEKNGKSALHMVSAWASENALVLGQRKTDSKSNEITAIPELIQLLDISGCVVTVDAMGCQKNIAELIIKKQADYVLTLKENQGNLFDEVQNFFLEAEANHFQDPSICYYETQTKNHGRFEVRRSWITDEISELQYTTPWKNLRLIGMVESERTVAGKTTKERRFFISSLEKDVALFAKAVRQHWGIENSVHWVLDIGFREDESRIRTGHAPENMAVLRHIALNLLRSDDTPLGIKNKRLKAALNTEYLTSLLCGEMEKLQ